MKFEEIIPGMILQRSSTTFDNVTIWSQPDDPKIGVYSSFYSLGILKAEQFLVVDKKFCSEAKFCSIKIVIFGRDTVGWIDIFLDEFERAEISISQFQ